MDWAKNVVDPLNEQAELITRLALESTSINNTGARQVAETGDDPHSQTNETRTPKNLSPEKTSRSNSTSTVPTSNIGKLFAISDLHLSFGSNCKFWADLESHPDDGLILAGDIGETEDHLELAFSSATKHFNQVWWCPGNHELYSVPKSLTITASRNSALRGEAKYMDCVEIARRYQVLTPEDDFVIWNGDGGPLLITPIFTLYDYSFAPDEVPLGEAVSWAKELGIEATDEKLLHPDPYKSKAEWCSALVSKFDQKLDQAVRDNPDVPLVIVNHWPLRRDTVRLFQYPRFIIWCGTRKTEDWHARFNAKVVVTGHIHIRRTDWIAWGDSWTRFEEVSMGYPRQWKDAAERGLDINELLREISPGPSRTGFGETRFRRYG
ncbi:hypothetical protein BT63DRAFT_459915 [Microthyrium microscopicum]|uniref:Calcineurin-like phosphoesterase domain-containing protein n=1 Tax=Microthyrium microscopicum TaxID=703497 RepID=A0A6A6TZ30_9PEZI|nr:hypothetical protein BT63DRAFT_459915 [Microthyrium microscopicum]